MHRLCARGGHERPSSRSLRPVADESADQSRATARADAGSSLRVGAPPRTEGGPRSLDGVSSFPNGAREQTRPPATSTEP
jgi:hypothetical protein